MITIAWYNVVAIVVGIVALMCTRLIPKDKGGLSCIATFYGSIVWIALVVIFYAVWGGIFWW